MASTLKDIAEYSGVSMMTVSRVINNSGYVSDRTRKKVEAAIKELDYRPNLMARSLINRKSSFVYVIVPDISNPFYAELTKGVEHVALRFGYHIMLSSGHWDEELEAAHIETARGRMAEAVILVLPKMSEKRIAEYQKDTNLVVVDKHIRSRNIDSVYIQQDKGAAAAVQHLIDLGHRRIAFLSGSRRIYNSLSRRRGYETALDSNGVPRDPRLVIPGDFSFESGLRAFDHIMKLSRKIRPTALFAASDLMALGVMRGASQNHFRIPQDLSLVGFDDINLSSITNPPLTTVRHPFIEMGEEAMRHVLRKLDLAFDGKESANLENRLIIRETTAPPFDA